jgi:hypothetical protein
MRKIISLGLLALMLSIFSSQVFAGNGDECKNLKDKTHVDYAPTLHGLCVAWYKADENAKDRIADNYRRRSGGDDVYGSASGMTCPCWAGVVLEDVDMYTSADICFLDTPNGDQIFFSDSQIYIIDGINCAHMAAYVDDSVTQVTRLSTRQGLDDADKQACNTEMDKLVNMYFDNGLDCY